MELANGKNNIFFNKTKSYINKYDIGEFDIYQNRANSNLYILTKNISHGSKVVDLGCGQGLVGYALRDSDCQIYGLDFDQDAIAKVNKKNYYERVYFSDITKDFFGLQQEDYKNLLNSDVVILSDILEHMEHPTEIILKAINLIKKDGIILISVPNIANSDIVLNLMDGKFNYTEMGILDNTHLKFFTKSSFLQWIRLVNEEYNLSLDCEYIGATFYESEYIKEFKKDYPIFYRLLSSYENNDALQIIFKIKLSEKKFIYEEEPIYISKQIGELFESNFKSANTLENIIINENLGKKFYIDIQEDYIIKQQERIKELEDGINWHNSNKEKLEKYMNKQQERIKELEDGINWHNSNKEKLEKYMNKQQERIKELENAIEFSNEENNKQKEYYINELEILSAINKSEIIKNNDLNKKIFMIENSKIIKILKKMRLLDE